MSDQKTPTPSIFSERYDDFAARFLCTFNGNVKCYFPLRKVMEEYYRFDNRVSCARLLSQLTAYGCKAYSFQKEVYVDMRSIKSVYYTPKENDRTQEGIKKRGVSTRGTKLLHIVIDVALMKAEKFGVGNQWSVQEEYEVVANARPSAMRNLFGEELKRKEPKKSDSKIAPVRKGVSLNVAVHATIYSFVESDKFISTNKQGV